MSELVPNEKTLQVRELGELQMVPTNDVIKVI